MITLEPRLYDNDGNGEIKILKKGYDDPGESPSLRSTASSNQLHNFEPASPIAER